MAEDTKAEDTEVEELLVTRIVVPAGGFEFVTPEGQTLLRIGLGPHGGSALTLFGPNGIPAVFLYGTGYGGDIGICRTDGRFVVRANAYEEEGALCVFDKNGAPTFGVPISKLIAARGQVKTDHPSENLTSEDDKD